MTTLYKVVDYFVLVESRVSHQDRPNALNYAENKRRFQKFSDKINHVVLDDLLGPSSHYKLVPLLDLCPCSQSLTPELSCPRRLQKVIQDSIGKSLKTASKCQYIWKSECTSLTGCHLQKEKQSPCLHN